MRFKTFYLKESFETDYKKFIAYHQTSKDNADKIKRFGFNLKNALQNIIWFTNNKNGIAENSTGSNKSGAVLKLEVTINKAADWDLYENKTLDELESLGYDGVILKESDGTFDGFVFSPKQLKVISAHDSIEDIKESEERNQGKLLSELKPSYLKETEEHIPEFIKVNGEERPTKNNLGEFIYNNLDDIISFWKWFGDSKIVDSSGRPILATHTTNNKFSEFDTEKTSSGAAWGKGIYFALDKKWSGGKFTKHCYLKSVAPLGKKIAKEDLQKLSKFVGRDVDALPILTLEKRGGDLISGLVLAGFDSFISDGPGSTGLHIVIPNKTQIREVKETENIVKESEERTHGKLLSELKPSLKTVMIFRARDSKGDEFDSKDYVTLSSKFALEHAESNHVYNDEQYIVIRATVPTNQLAEASNPGEWFYIGPKIHGDVVYKSLGPDDYEGKIIDLKFARKLKL